MEKAHLYLRAFPQILPSFYAYLPSKLMGKYPSKMLVLPLLPALEVHASIIHIRGERHPSISRPNRLCIVFLLCQNS
jgi:hypothetical protein